MWFNDGICNYSLQSSNYQKTWKKMCGQLGCKSLSVLEICQVALFSKVISVQIVMCG